jgi:hypothetical protein
LSSKQLDDILATVTAGNVATPGVLADVLSKRRCRVSRRRREWFADASAELTAECAAAATAVAVHEATAFAGLGFAAQIALRQRLAESMAASELSATDVAASSAAASVCDELLAH